MPRCSWRNRSGRPFDGMFKDLDIGREPTRYRNQYFIWRWDFSRIDAQGGVDALSKNIREHIQTQPRRFMQIYGDRLADKVELQGSADAIISSLAGAVLGTDHKIYLLIDEYDNFVNQVVP